MHPDHVAHKLQDDPVQWVIEPLPRGAAHRGYTTHDLEYVRDLGLIALDPKPASPIRSMRKRCRPNRPT